MFLGHRKVKGLVGLFLLIAAIAGIYYWEFHGRKSLTYIDVVVLSEDIKARTLVTADMLKHKKVERDSFISGSIADPEKIIGMEARHFIPRNMQLHEKFFDIPELVLNENEFITVFPSEWIHAFPSSIRRKDIVYIYLVEESKQVKEASNDEDVDIINDFENLKNFDNESVKLPIDFDGPILSLPVAYVKDRANREVVDVGKSERLDGSSQIAEIHVIVTVDKLDTLKDYYQHGYEFLLLYKN